MNDVEIAKKYLAKFKDANKRGIHFDLPFTSFKNLMNAKKCAYTGVVLTQYDGKKFKGTDRAVERVDNNQGYVVGNVKAVCFAANQLKNCWEHPGSVLNIGMIKKMVNSL